MRHQTIVGYFADDVSALEHGRRAFDDGLYSIHRIPLPGDRPAFIGRTCVRA
jgi:hypothetical protein